QYFERSLMQTEVVEQNLNAICNALDVLAVVIEHKSEDWFLSHMNVLHRLLERSLQSDNVRVIKSLQPVLGIIYKNIPIGVENLPSDVTNFMTAIETIIQDG